MKRLLLGWFGLIISALMVCPLMIFAQEATSPGRISTGKLTLLPELVVSEAYDSNIYMGNNHTAGKTVDADWLTKIKPKLGLKYAYGENGSISLGADATKTFYNKYSDNDWHDYGVNFGINHDAPSGLILGFSEAYKNAQDPYGSSNDYGLGTLKQRYNNTLDGKLGYDFGHRVKAIAYTKFYVQDYNKDDDYTQDWYTLEFGVGAEIRFLPKTWGFVRYHYGEQTFTNMLAGSGLTDSNAANNRWNRVNAGLGWDPGGKLSGELNFGYGWLGYENSFDTQGNAFTEIDSWIAETSVDYEVTETTLFTLNIHRTVKMVGAATYEDYTDTSVGFILKQTIYSILDFAGGFNYEHDDYDTGRKDNVYKYDLGLTYQMVDWLSTNFKYEYQRKDSSADSNDYTDHNLTLSLKAAY